MQQLIGFILTSLGVILVVKESDYAKYGTKDIKAKGGGVKKKKIIKKKK